MDQIMILKKYPNFGRFALLQVTLHIYLFQTNSKNFDSYFFSPAIFALQNGYDMPNTDAMETHFFTLMKFISKGFNVSKHAIDFNFNDIETVDQFLLRFLKHLESENSVPKKVRNATSALHQTVRNLKPRDKAVEEFSLGVMKPCSPFIYMRILTLIQELDLDNYKKKKHLNCLDKIIQFLTKDYKPAVHAEGLDLKEESAEDVVRFLEHAEVYGLPVPLLLNNGMPACEKNKEFLNSILPKVPETVKEAIDNIMPHYPIRRTDNWRPSVSVRSFMDPVFPVHAAARRFSMVPKYRHTEDDWDD